MNIGEDGLHWKLINCSHLSLAKITAALFFLGQDYLPCQNVTGHSNYSMTQHDSAWLPLLDDPPWRGASSAAPKWWPQALNPQLPMGNRRQKKSTLCILNELNDFTWFCHVYIYIYIYIYTVSVWLDCMLCRLNSRMSADVGDSRVRI